MKNILIGDYDKQFKSDELEYKDFISRKEFINRTGIYVSALFFESVYHDYKESGLSVDDFVNTYETKEPIMEAEISGKFKYNVTDEVVSGIGTYDEIHDPNVHEIVNAIDMELCHKIKELEDLMIKVSKLCKDCEEHSRQFWRFLAEYGLVESAKIPS